MSRKKQRPDHHHFGIALPDNLYVERFTYPMSTTKIDKKWEKSPGLRIASCCKMLFGPEPFRWYGPESPQRLLEDMATMGIHWVSDGQGGWHCNADIAEPIATATVVEVPYDEHWEPAPLVVSWPSDDEEEEPAPKPRRRRTAAQSTDDKQSGDDPPRRMRLGSGSQEVSPVDWAAESKQTELFGRPG